MVNGMMLPNNLYQFDKWNRDNEDISFFTVFNGYF